MELTIILISTLATAIICLASRQRLIIEFASVISAFVTLFESTLVALKVSSFGTYTPYKFITIDSLGAIVMLIISLVGSAAVMYSVAYLREETKKQIIGFTRVKQYFVLLNLFLAAMFLAVASNNPILTWISIEATTLSTAFLISFYNKPTSLEAAWKYLVINSVGLLLGFFGTLLYFTSFKLVGEANTISWNTLLLNAGYLDPMIAKIAFVFVLIGYGTKIGFAPMHTWLPDAHSKAPAPISALLSGVLLNVAFIAVLRFKLVTDAAVGIDFSRNLLIIFGLLSIFVASLIIFTQKNYKRMLAYSSIENMGIIALGFGFGGLGSVAALLHMIYHSLLKSSLFFSAGNIFLKYSSTKIDKIKGTMKALPITAVLFLMGFFAITGTPPFGVFLTKIYILSAGMSAHPIVTVISFVLMSLVFVGFFQKAAAMTFGEKPQGIDSGENNVWLIIPSMAFITIVVCLSFYIPPFLINLLNSTASHY